MSWNPFGVAFELEASGSNVVRKSATQFTVKITAAWETYYNGAQTNYGMTASSGGGSVNLNTFGDYASSGSGSFTGTYSISGNGSATKTITVTFRNYNTDNGDSATDAVSFNVYVPAWTSYTVSYNANGGSGAPSSQTKWKDQTLKLSSTKPTRTGYTFSKWNTKSDGSGTSYSSGANYTANSAATLYAIWTENALTVNYYSNYATESFADALNTVGADKNVIVRTSKFYYDNSYPDGHWDYSFTDSLTYLGRTGYTATGYWGTSSSGGTLIKQSTEFASGQAMAEAVGKSLKTGNASINLYAQWKINTYTIAYNANGGTGTMSSQSIEWNETFIISNNYFVRDGYKFLGWNAYRNTDGKWHAANKGWLTEDEISSDGYNKSLYESQEEHVLNQSWIRGNESSANQYTMYAVWEISGVVYIDNGTTFEPYLTYIDNGTEWELYLMYVDDGTDWDIIS